MNLGLERRRRGVEKVLEGCRSLWVVFLFRILESRREFFCFRNIGEGNVGVVEIKEVVGVDVRVSVV